MDMDWIWIGYGLEILENYGYGSDLKLEFNPSGTSAHNNELKMIDIINIYIIALNRNFCLFVCLSIC